jgi:tetratricopeptide (TPR) repeat protein
MRRKRTLTSILTALTLTLYALPAAADSLPEWFLPLRDAIYEQNLSANEIAVLYAGAKERADAELSGADRLVMISRIEYMMGRAYHYEERKREAIARYEAGMAAAEAALKERDSAEGWQMLAENLSQNCAVHAAAYAIAHGLNVEKYAKKALAKDQRNTASLFMLAARWVYAPSPFNNIGRGIQMMQDIITNYESEMPPDDLFNVYSSIGYGYLQQKKKADAKVWLQKSLEIYPANKYIRGLYEKI